MSAVSDLVAFNPLIDFNRKNNGDIEYEDNFSCPQIYQRLVVGADGLVMLCANDEEGECIVGDANKERIYEIWHGKKMKKAREIHMQKDGFKKIAICKKCYLPRKTRQDLARVGNRVVIVQNYT
jgi:radical SAM protein with 4Fe4S-binding SPASM domain